jgi:outer membrane protein
VLVVALATVLTARTAGAAEGDVSLWDSPPRPITLAEAVALAQQYSPQAIQARGQLRTTAAARRSSYAAFLPNVSLTSGASRQYPTRAGGTRIENGEVITLPDQTWSYSGGLGANLELFDGGRRFFDAQAAGANATAAKVNEVTQRFAAALDAKQQYFNVLAARESQTAARAQVDQAEAQLRTAIARVAQRSATRSDSLRAEIQRRNAQLAVMDAQTALDVANASLTRSVGTQYPVTAASADSAGLPALPLGAEDLRQLAVNGPLVLQAKAALDATRATKRGAWTNYLPTLSASYSRSRSGTSDEFGFQADSYDYSGALRLSLSLPLFDQLGREEQIVRADVAQTNAEAELRDARLAALQSLTTSLGAFRAAEQRIAAQTASVEAGEEDLRVQQQRYALGSSTLLDVLTSQTQLDQARQDLIRARYDQRVAHAQLELLIGRDL